MLIYIDGFAGEEEELAKLVERLDKASIAYGMEKSAEKTKLMTNNTSSINTETKINGQKLEAVTSFKYLDSMIITLNTAMTETASEILGKHRQKKKPWVTAEILDLCDKSKEMRKTI